MKEIRRQHTIWNEITEGVYDSEEKNYGVADTGEVSVKIGSSRGFYRNFLQHTTTRRFEEYDGRKVCVFRHSVDGVVVKIMIFEDEKGKAGKHIKTISKLKSIKSIKI